MVLSGYKLQKLLYIYNDTVSLHMINGNLFHGNNLTGDFSIFAPNGKNMKIILLMLLIFSMPHAMQFAIMRLKSEFLQRI